MPQIQPINAICFAPGSTPGSTPGRLPADVSDLIAPPYDVLDEKAKRQLLAQNPHNIVGVDLPHLPAKSAGPDAVYQQAADTLQSWLADGVLARLPRPACFVYHQHYQVGAKTYVRRGLLTNIALQPFGRSESGGGVFPHEQTFSGPKEDRLKLMRATRCQLSPIFGLYSDPEARVAALADTLIADQPPTFIATTANDQVQHRLWTIDAPDAIAKLSAALSHRDIFIADGHHRYTTALNYRDELKAAGPSASVPAAANFCMFTLVAMQDPGMIVLPTHRVLSGMPEFSMARFIQAAGQKLAIQPISSADPADLEKAVHQAASDQHAIGLFDATQEDPHRRLWLATTPTADPLSALCPEKSAAWRSLDVAIAQYLIVEDICQPTFAADGQITWAFPHTLAEFIDAARPPHAQLGLWMKPTPLAAVQAVSEAGEVMPQKSTFFYPKIATGLVVNPLT